MARSARSRFGRRSAAGAGVALAAAGALAGCVSTQTKAARLRINADRIRASQSDTRVAAANPQVTVTGLGVVGAGRRTAFVVTVRNTGARAISDLPISVGYRRHAHRPVYLNAAAGLEYFDAHLPAIAAHRSLTWVFAPTHGLPRGARPFALVGRAATVAEPGQTGRPPSIRVGVDALAGDRLTVRVRNLSSIPQYQLPVYAVAERSGRTVAAGVANVKELDGGASQTLRLVLLGRPGSSGVQLAAAATIVH